MLTPLPSIPALTVCIGRCKMWAASRCFELPFQLTGRNTLSDRTDRKGPAYALLAAILFGASTPFAKLLLGQTQPILLAALLYSGSGAGLSAWLILRYFIGQSSREASLRLSDLPWLGTAILAGGIMGPVLLLIGLKLTPASSASLLLNLEGMFTATIAWFIFKENFDLRIALGMIA